MRASLIMFIVSYERREHELSNDVYIFKQKIIEKCTRKLGFPFYRDTLYNNLASVIKIDISIKIDAYSVCHVQFTERCDHYVACHIIRITLDTFVWLSQWPFLKQYKR